MLSLGIISVIRMKKLFYALLLTTTALLAEEVIKLDPFEVSATRSKINVYKSRTEKVWDTAQTNRTICYNDILTVVYRDFNIPDLLLEKKTYRDTVGKDCTWFCNYAAFNTKIPINFTVSDVGSAKEGNAPREDGRFDWKTKKLIIRDGARTEYLYHLAGIGLSGFPSHKSLERVKEMGRQHRDVEFYDKTLIESQLQELNRFYVTVAGKVIYTPVDALHAIILLGAKVPRASVEKIFTRNKIPYSAPQLTAVLSATETNMRNFGYFRYAIALIEGNQSSSTTLDGEGNLTVETNIELVGLTNLTGDKYEACLENILMQAPGHL